jgi:EmrB/QacA subfamily drug resistance transporter
MSSPTHELAADHPAALPSGRRWAALAVLLAGAFMTLIDMTVVNVAIPSIQSGIGAAYQEVEWVVSGYALTYGLMLVAGGRLGDLYGHNRVFVLSLLGFVGASLVCGVTQTGGQLIAARVVQGVMAGLMYPQVTAFIQVFFKGRERGQAYAVLGATIGLASVIGPLVGGALIAADLGSTSWRPIFLVNVPVGLVAAAAAIRMVPGSKGPAGRLDLGGLLLVSTGLFALTLGLIEGRAAGWAWWIYALIAAAGPLFWAFLAWERRQSARGRDTVLDPRLLSSRPFAAGALIALVFFAGFSSLFFTLSLYLQQGLGLSALAAGAASVPFALGAFAGAACTEPLGNRLAGHRLVTIGAAMVLAGLVGLVAVVHAAGVGLHALALAPALLVAGLGCGLVIAPLIELALEGVPWQQAGAAAGVLNAMQRLGTAIGVALVGVTLFAALGAHAPAASRAVAPALAAQIGADESPAAAAAASAAFERCFVRQSRAHDPTATVAGCRGPGSQANPAIAAAARGALRQNFTHAFQIATTFNIAAVALTLLLAPLLAPRARGRRVSQTPAPTS